MERERVIEQVLEASELSHDTDEEQLVIEWQLEWDDDHAQQDDPPRALGREPCRDLHRFARALPKFPQASRPRASRQRRSCFRRHERRCRSYRRRLSQPAGPCDLAPRVLRARR